MPPAAVSSPCMHFYVDDAHTTFLTLRSLLCRKWLKASAQGGLAETSTSASDTALHNALLKTDVVTSVKQLYLQKEVASEPANALRGVLVGLLKEKPNVRRADVMDAARAEGVNVSDGIYQKVMKDLCTSRGNIWTLKSGAQSL